MRETGTADPFKKMERVEATTIKSCDSILKRRRIHHDYTDECDQERFPKHAAILQLIIDSMTKTAYELSPDDLAAYLPF